MDCECKSWCNAEGRLIGAWGHHPNCKVGAAEEEWMKKYQARICELVEDFEGVAPAYAKASLENLNFDTTENPEDAAYEDLSCFSD